MVKDIKYLHKVKIKKEFGKMENSLNGFHDNKKNKLIYINLLIILIPFILYHLLSFTFLKILQMPLVAL